LVVGAIYSIAFAGVDAAGNAAVVITNTEVTYAPDVTPPTVLSISYQQPTNALTNEKSVTFRVVFSEPVTHVDADDFTKTLATVFGGTISVTSVDETTYDVTFSVSGSGTVRLDVLAAATIMDLTGNDFNADFRDGAVYTIDQTPPVFSSISPNASTTVNGTEVGYTLSEELASGTITWTRTGGTEDPNTHVQELAATELAKGSHPSALLTNSPTLVSGAVYSIAFDGTDLAGNSSQTVVVNSIVYQPTANKLSDIVESTNFTYPQNIDNIIFQEPADIQNTGTSIVVAKFTIRDGGANLKDVDPFPTTLTGLTLDLGANSSVINRIALYDDAGEIEFEGSELLVANQTVSFTNIAIECPDNSERTFSIRVSFAAQVTDNSQFSLTITGTTTETGKSGLAAVDGGGASTSTANANNQIEVIATTFKFIQQPTNTFVNVEMSPAVSLEAVDENGNRDLDFEGSVVLTSSGSLSGDPTVLLTEGFGTYSSLVHSAGGAGLTLTASGGSNLQDGISALYDIYDDNDPIPLSIHSLITPTAHDANNNVLYIENIDFFPENTVKLIDRYGVSVKSWVNFSNYDTASPEQPDFDFSGLVVGNYICIVQFRDNQGDKRNQSQMITVLK
jgi:hypothetical protein